MTRPTSPQLLGALTAALLLGACSSDEPEPAPPSEPETKAPERTLTIMDSAPDDPAAPDIADDGFPTGHATPEAAAADFVRAIIKADPDLLRESSLQLPSDSESTILHNQFLDQTESELRAAPGSLAPDIADAQNIKAVYRARPLTSPEPKSYGFTVLNVRDVRFVDIEAEMFDASTFSNRTLVVQTALDKRWYAIPRPDFFPRLSEGLNQEPESTERWEP